MVDWPLMDFSPTLPTDDPYTLGIYAAIVISGVVICFFGNRFFKYALGVLLAIAGAGGGAYLATHLGAIGSADAASPEGVHSTTYMLVGMGVGALVGLIISFVFVKAAGAVAGALLGYVLIAPNIGTLDEFTGIGFLVGGCALGALLGVFLVNPVVIIATGFIGAFQVIYGGLFFFDGTQILILGEDPAAGWQILSARQTPFIAMMALGCAGVVVQVSRKWRRRRRED